MAEDRYLVDSNVLIRWTQPADPGYAVSERAIWLLSEAGAVLCYTSQNLGEFWNTQTRPVARNGYGLTPKEASLFVQPIESHLELLPDSLAVHEEWRRMLVDFSISGVQVHDARLAAAMRVHGVQRILTFNTRDFARFRDLEAIHPKDVR